jgi:hypothetical protein
LDSVARRLELLKLEGLGFSQAEIVNELSLKLPVLSVLCTRIFRNVKIGNLLCKV